MNSIVWQYSIDPQHKYKPVISFVVIKEHPFTYAITLKAFVRGRTRNIRRWDNVHGAHHEDHFFLHKKAKKHLPSCLGPIRSIDELTSVGKFIEERWKEMMREFLEK